jgi:hypothetical protein
LVSVNAAPGCRLAGPLAQPSPTPGSVKPSSVTLQVVCSSTWDDKGSVNRRNLLQAVAGVCLSAALRVGLVEVPAVVPYDDPVFEALLRPWDLPKSLRVRQPHGDGGLWQESAGRERPVCPP